MLSFSLLCLCCAMQKNSTVKAEGDMSTVLEHKEAIREVIDLFSNLEIDVLEQFCHGGT